MSYINEIEFPFEIGDSYEVSPAEGSYLIGRISALGGECYVDGNNIVVTKMPGKTYQPAKTPAAVEADAPVAEEPPVEAPEVEEASDEVVETPIKRTRKPKAEESEVLVDEDPIPAPVEE